MNKDLSDSKLDEDGWCIIYPKSQDINDTTNKQPIQSDSNNYESSENRTLNNNDSSGHNKIMMIKNQNSINKNKLIANNDKKTFLDHIKQMNNSSKMTLLSSRADDDMKILKDCKNEQEDMLAKVKASNKKFLDAVLNKN